MRKHLIGNVYEHNLYKTMRVRTHLSKKTYKFCKYKFLQNFILIIVCLQLTIVKSTVFSRPDSYRES